MGCGDAPPHSGATTRPWALREFKFQVELIQPSRKSTQLYHNGTLLARRMRDQDTRLSGRQLWGMVYGHFQEDQAHSSAPRSVVATTPKRGRVWKMVQRARAADAEDAKPKAYVAPLRDQILDLYLKEHDTKTRAWESARDRRLRRRRKTSRAAGARGPGR